VLKLVAKYEILHTRCIPLLSSDLFVLRNVSCQNLPTSQHTLSVIWQFSAQDSANVHHQSVYEGHVKLFTAVGNETPYSSNRQISHVAKEGRVHLEEPYINIYQELLSEGSVSVQKHATNSSF